MSEMLTEAPTPLVTLRAAIDDVDDRMLGLLAERAEIVAGIAEAKRGTGLASVDPERERAVLSRLVEKGAGRFPAAGITAVFREVMSASVSLQRPVTVACLGPAGTWTESAARALFGFAPAYLEEPTIDAVFERVRRGEAEHGVVPFESSLEGSVHATLDALIEGGCLVRREIVLPITQCLVAASPDLGTIERVYSHPQAFGQCRRWLAAHLPRVAWIHTSSTAAAVVEAARDARGAAIAGARAAELAGLPVVREGVQDRPDGATRFVAIARTDAPRTGDDRTTLAFGVSDDRTRGALRRALGVLDDAGVNMTRIESRPRRDEAWRYAFVADVEGHRCDPSLSVALEELRQHAEWVRVLGSYPRHRSAIAGGGEP